MRWEQLLFEFTELPDSEIPPELLSGFERYADESTLVKIRLRWRPHESMSRGFLTRDRLVELESVPTLEMARAVASYARHLYEQGECEGRFEAQVRREFDDPDKPGRRAREWRSITFYVDPLPSERAKQMQVEPDDDLDEHDDDAYDAEPDADDDDEPDADERLPTPRPPVPRARHASPQPRMTRVPLSASRRASEPPPTFAQYAQESELYRSDPMVYAMSVVRQTYDRVVDTYERALFVSFDRLDRTLESQHSHSEFINEAMQTVTRGAGEIAGVGIDLFRSGMQHQVDTAALEQESEIGKERTEVMRDAVQQGSLLAQAVIMSNATKQRGATEQPTDEPARARSHKAAPGPEATPPRPEPEPEQQTAETAAPSHVALESALRQFIDKIPREVVDKLRPDAPVSCKIFDDLCSGPISAAAAKQLFSESQVPTNEYMAVMAALGNPMVVQLLDLRARLIKEVP